MNNNQGGITVYLSLSLLLIMALLGTMIEVSRAKVCRVHGKRTLDTAVECLMTEYSRPLYDRYGLFFLEDAGTSFEESIAGYVGEILGGKNLYEGVLKELEINGKRCVGDDGGAALQAQIEAKMKRKIAEDVIQAGQTKGNSAVSLEESAQEIEEQVEKEEEEAEAGVQMMELMKLVDGVICGKGSVRGTKYFTKMFYRGDKKGENLGITESTVWDAVKEKMVSLDTTLPDLGKVETRERFRNQVENACEKTSEALQIVRELSAKIATLELGTNPEATLEGNLAILKETLSILDGEIAEEEIEQLDGLWKNYDTLGIVFSYNGINESGGEENPWDSFSKALSDGIMDLVIKEQDTISEKKWTESDMYRKWYEASLSQEDYGERIQQMTKKQKVKLQGTMGGYSELSLSDYFLMEYVKRYFSHWRQQSKEREHSLKYEVEYLIGGEKSDKENLEQMINRLFLVRTTANTAVLMASAKHRESAHAAALAVVGFTGMEPLIRFTQTTFLVLWGMAEALVDVAGILQGKHVGLVKSSADLQVKFEDLFQIGREYVLGKAEKLPEEGKASFGYEDYATLFLLGENRENICYRMMDLMQANVRLDEIKNFNLAMCVDSFQANGVFTFPTKFFRVPWIRDLIERELYQFQSEASTKALYVPD